MDDNLISDEEIAARNAELKRALARTDPKGIAASIKAYRHELPQLLAEDHEGHVVAYCDGRRVDIAQSRDGIQAILEAKKLANHGGLFVTRITSTDIGELEFSPR
jgi:hypothetical protein